MALDQQLADCLTETINVAGPLDITYSPGGTETILRTRAVKAYIERGIMMVNAGDGTSESVTDMIITEEAITLDDRIWLPGDDTSTSQFSRQPRRVDALPDVQHPGTISHYETTL